MDTNILSEIMRPKPDSGVIKFLKKNRELWVSVISMHELTYGLLKLQPGQRRDCLATTLDEMKDLYSERILPVSLKCAERSAVLRVAAHQQGRVCHLADSLLAGTALTHDLILATRNVRDFDYLPLRWTNPWETP